MSELSNGVDGFGWKTMLKGIDSLSEEGGEMTEKQFVTVVLLHLSPASVSSSYSVEISVEELKRAGNKWYVNCGLFYDLEGNIFRIDGEIKEATSNRSRCHMNGRLNPRTLAEFTDVETEQLRQIDPANLLHNSNADHS
jgi:hypothetical protein